ncbi:uncharacterized protein IL334_001211 [Kwoniella shivajii]|uniref:Hydantoinase B/oxoprolinase domain-containing protein n=1 Tax=Kwoniella shivajii TaxID=564305 RepID=A0ABZ1CSV9_9TREE|nr:hypothetical protein IL334_001211 [Kwoniella shivajii]
MVKADYDPITLSLFGDLVANAPFVPVHLGSMSWSVKYQLRLHGKGLKDGDVLLTNSPIAGGSDIGGILPGSMPPTSTQLYEEGANIHSLKIVSDGYYDHDALYKVMVEDPAKYPGCSGSRSFKDVESDVKAQIAANNKGTNLLKALVKEYDLKTVHDYMDHIKNMRSMIGEDIPLNAGCLVPIDIRIPDGCLLSPSPESAVCGGNVMTSQRITDTVLLAFEACAASQGCCNKSRDFGTTLSPSSGGAGKFHGGEGCIRSLQFLQPLSVSILSERRSRAPYGLAGGGPGATGLNIWVKQPKHEDGKVRTINVGGKGTMQFGTGDMLVLHTPGGGGWGTPEHGVEEDRVKNRWEPRGTWADKAQPDF